MSNLSFQLPDLVAHTNSFPFRINRNCKYSTERSEGWLLGHEFTGYEPPVLLDDEMRMLPSAKYGLLASLCSPTADAPQLKVLADFWSLVFISHTRILKGSTGSAWPLSIHAEDVEDGMSLLVSHELFRSLVPPLECALSSRSSEYQLKWKRRFAQSTKVFATSQVLLSSDLRTGKVPDFPDFIALRRDTHASSMFIDLIDLLEITHRPLGCSAKDAEGIEHITMWAAYVTGWTLEIFSFASGPGEVSQSPMPTHSPSHNLISLLIAHKSLSVQGAMNFAGGMVKGALDEIQRLERELLPSSVDSSGTSEGQGWSEWLGSGVGMVKSAVGFGDPQSSLVKSRFLADVPVEWTGSSSRYEDAASERRQSPEQRAAEIAQYVRAMKDWIVGTVHWGYESELYFGQKGDEVRSFGWVFLTGGDSQDGNST